MNILEFIEEKYPIREKVLSRLEDPYKRIANEDNLPYDKIGPDESGVITKLVEVEEGRFISVKELISFYPDDVEIQTDEALRNVYTNYMQHIQIEDINIADILAIVKKHKELASKKEEQLNVLRLQKG